MDKGVLYIATGEEYVEQAKRSSRIVSEQMDIPIAVVSDRAFEYEYVDQVIIDDDPQYTFADKPRNLLKSPFEKTLYLDTDVYMLEPCGELLEMLDRVDIATTIDPNEYEVRTLGLNPYDIPESFPVYSTGVIPYSLNDSVERFIEIWLDYQNEDDYRDQTTFRGAMYNRPAELTHSALLPKYNFLIGSPMREIGPVKLIHDNKNNIKSISHLEKYAERINENTGQRLVYSYDDTIRAPLSLYTDRFFAVVSLLVRTTDLLSFLIEDIRKEGPRHTIERISSYLSG